MQISPIEHDILTSVHNLPIEKQQEILDFSLFLQTKTAAEEKIQPSHFTSSLRAFLDEANSNPLGIDTDIFDDNRAVKSGRNFQL